MARRCCSQGLVVPKGAKLVETVPVLEAEQIAAEQARSIAPAGTLLRVLAVVENLLVVAVVLALAMALARVPGRVPLLEQKLVPIVPACCRCSRGKP